MSVKSIVLSGIESLIVIYWLAILSIAYVVFLAFMVFYLPIATTFCRIANWKRRINYAWHDWKWRRIARRCERRYLCKTLRRCPTFCPGYDYDESKPGGLLSPGPSPAFYMKYNRAVLNSLKVNHSESD